MKFLKLYESFTNEPQVGDYVLMGTNSRNKYYKNFIKNTPGQILDISPFLVSVKYDNIPIKLLKLKLFEWNGLYNYYYHTFNKKKLLVFSDIPNDLELKLNAKKYNL